MSEEAEIIMDHKPYHGQKRRCIDVFDFSEIPEQVKHSIHHIKGLDGVFKEIRRPPREWINVWIKLDYGNPRPLLFDMEGHPYIMAPAKKKPGVEIKVLIKEKGQAMLEHLETATDFCDYCNAPLESSESHWLEEDGEAIADIYVCEYCEKESIRWDKGFLEFHPVLGELKTR